MPRQPLPIDDLIPDILASLEDSPNLVIEAEPGAGKTTRVPAALLASVRGHVLVLEPRRIAARLAARRVAWELSEQIGHTVGYQVRFERVAGPHTRLHFLTEGVLTRRLFSDPELKGVDAVVLDEFHERHLESDLALTLLRRLQTERPDLCIVIMSATLDSVRISHFLDDCRVLRSAGRVFDLSVDYTPYSSAPLHERVRDAVEMLLKTNQPGEVLAFLPGVAEIHRAARACEPLARKFGRIVLPLYGDLPAAEQDRALGPAPHPKLVLATNVAESSITIDGVTAVIDSGLARIAAHSEWTGLPTLKISRISKASARQRAGRAARTAPGRAIRLYSQSDYENRADYELPEILRSDLAQLCLALRAMGIERPDELQWLDSPPARAIANAEELLDLLGATQEEAHRLMRFPLHPRLSRMIDAATKRGSGRAACMTAALLGSGGRRKHSDLLAALEEPIEAATQQQLNQLLKLISNEGPPNQNDDALLQSVLLGFPDRVAQRKSGNQVLLSNGRTAETTGTPSTYSFMVALDAEDRSENPAPLIRLASRIEPEWLLDFFPDRVQEETTIVWNRQAERVDSMSRLLYDKLILHESSGVAADAEVAADLLADKAIEAGIERFVDAEMLEDFMGRLEFAGVDPPQLSNCMREFCRGRRSFAELRNAGGGFLSWLETRLDAHRLNELAPRTIRLKSGRQVKVHYQCGKTPWVASRLQDFFGMTDTPRLGPNKTPVVLQLLSPNRQPVQTTTDLEGFWTRLYPHVRRDLMRRYPRHRWPEQHDR